MSDKRVVILDGSRQSDVADLAPALAVLTEEYKAGGAEVEVFALRDIKLAHCVGCFGCWVKTPGICVEVDAGRGIARAIVQSDTTVLLSPVVFGGYSPELKKMVDRFLPLVLPFFGEYHGEFHHQPRYSRYPRLVGVGVQREGRASEGDVFRALVGRNALNFHAPSHAVEIVHTADDHDDLRRRVHSLVSREDPWPLGDALEALSPVVNPAAVVANHNGAQRALLIVGSPKVRNPSTSAALGGYLASQLANRGWETETLKLKASTTRTGGQAELLSTVNRADLLILAFPLYIDSPPLLVLKALETIAADRSASSDSHRPRLAVISNNGFPEAHHNAPAIAMCHEFALQTGMTWAGALAMGAGEAISSGQPLAEISASGLPTGHVLRALETAAAALAAGRPIPEESMSMIASVPIPGAPVQAWHQVFLQTASQHWVEEAAAQGVSDEQLRDRPYAELEMSCA